jgi:hypothetical protein
MLKAKNKIPVLIIIRITKDYFHEQHQVTGVCNEEAECLL